MDASKPVVARAAADVGSVATQIWLWGQGTRPQLPDFAARHGVTGRLSSAVDLVRGLGVLSGIEVLDVAGATAGFDNDYVAQRDAALSSLADHDFFLLHVEATDEAGHQGAIDEKVASLERWDADIIGPLVDALAGEPYRILLLPDHATPVPRRARTRRTRCPTSSTAPTSPRPVASTPSAASPDGRRCPRTTSWRVCWPDRAMVRTLGRERFRRHRADGGGKVVQCCRRRSILRPVHWTRSRFQVPKPRQGPRSVEV